MKTKIFTLVTLAFLGLSNANAQVKVGTNPTTIHNTAALEVESTTKGFLPPRMTTTERDLIASPAEGLVIYNTDVNCLQWFNNTGWFDGCEDILTGASFAQVVYVNANDPATATEFFLDPENPTNDTSLAQNSANIYIGQDGSTWTWDGTAYQTYEFPATVPHGFRAQLNNNAVTVSNANATFTSNYQTLENTAGGAWDPATGTFTAARAGWYQANASVLYSSANWAANRYSQINIFKNNVVVAANLAMREEAVTGNLSSSATSSAAVYLNVGDTLRVQLFQNSGSNKVTHSPIYNTFSVIQIK